MPKPLENDARANALSRRPAPEPEPEPALEEPAGDLSEVAAHLEAILPSLPPEQLEIANQALQLLLGASGGTTPAPESGLPLDEESVGGPLPV